MDIGFNVMKYDPKSKDYVVMEDFQWIASEAGIEVS